jgi:hypothetical protein
MFSEVAECQTEVVGKPTPLGVHRATHGLLRIEALSQTPIRRDVIALTDGASFPNPTHRQHPIDGDEGLSQILGIRHAEDRGERIIAVTEIERCMNERDI